MLYFLEKEEFIMPKLRGFGFANYEVKQRLIKETLYDKIIDWSKIDILLKKYYKKNKCKLSC